jgi:hypothetical protein
MREQRPAARATGEAVDLVAARHQHPHQGNPDGAVHPATKTFILPPHSSPRREESSGARALLVAALGFGGHAGGETDVPR